MIVSTGTLPPVDVHTEADVRRLFASLGQVPAQLLKGADRGVQFAQALPSGDLAAEFADDDVAVALRIQNAVRHSLFRPMLRVRHAL